MSFSHGSTNVESKQESLDKDKVNDRKSTQLYDPEQAVEFLAKDEVDRAEVDLFDGMSLNNHSDPDNSLKNLSEAASAAASDNIAHPLSKSEIDSPSTLLPFLNHSSPTIVIDIPNSGNNDNGKGIGKEFWQLWRPESKEQPKNDYSSEFKKPLLASENTEFDSSQKDELLELTRTKKEIKPTIKEPAKPRSCEKYKKMIFEPSFVDKYMIPTGAMGLLLHDAFHYSLNSNKRYGTSFYEVFFGIAFKNPNYMLSNFFGTKAGDVRFWAPLSLMMFSTIVSHFIPKPQKLTAAFAKPLGGLYGRLPEPIKNGIRKIAFVGLLFGWGHYLKMISQKSAQLAIHYSKYLDCVNNGKAYTYLSHAVTYACTLCGFDFIYPPYLNSRQQCLNAVIKQNAPSSKIINYLNSIKLEGNVSSVTIPEAWLALTDNEITQLLDALLRHTGDRIERLTIEPSKGRRKPSNESLKAQADFIRRVNPRELVISGQYFGDSAVMLLSNCRDIAIESLIYTNNGLTNELSDDFFKNLPSTIQKLTLANNRLTMDASPKIASFGLRSSLQSLDISDNSFEFTNSFLNLNGTQIIEINVSGNVVRDGAGQAVGQALLDYPIRSLNIGNCGITNDCLISISPGFNSTTLASLDVSHNPINNESFMFLDQLPPNLKIFYLNGITPGLGGFHHVFKLINSTLTNELHLSGCMLVSDDMEEFSVLKQIEILDISNCNLITDEVKLFCAAYPDGSNLRQLDASGNDLSQEATNLLLETFKTINTLLLNNLNSNPLGSYAALSNESKIVRIETARTQIDSLSEDAISNITRGPLQGLTLSGTHLADFQLTKLTQSLITNPPNIDELSQEILSAETELQLDQCLATSQLQKLVLEDVPVNSSVRPFVNVLFKGGIDFERTGLGRDLTWRQSEDTSTAGLYLSTPLAIISFVMAAIIFCKKRHYFKNNLSCLFSKANKKTDTDGDTNSKVTMKNQRIQ